MKLGENNYNVHINFPLRATGGRSYGWTNGQVGDWSDRMYLDSIAQLMAEGDEDNIAAFYTIVAGIYLWLARRMGAFDAL